MKKQLLKAYDVLDLPFSATVDDVEVRKKAMIKTIQDDEHQKKSSREKDIKKIEDCALMIVENLKKDGAPSVERQSFDSSWASIGTMMIVLVFVAILCGISFYIFL